MLTDPIFAEQSEKQEVLETLSDIIGWLNKKKLPKQITKDELQKAVDMLFFAIINSDRAA